jgi:hypothetical protein
MMYVTYNIQTGEITGRIMTSAVQMPNFSGLIVPGKVAQNIIEITEDQYFEIPEFCRMVHTTTGDWIALNQSEAEAKGAPDWLIAQRY